MSPRAVVVGPPGSGKSTVGPLLAEHLGVGFRDADDDVVAAEGRSISDIFTTDGEAVFRAIEERSIAAALTEHDGVLSLGGGAVLSRRRARGCAGTSWSSSTSAWRSACSASACPPRGRCSPG